MPDENFEIMRDIAAGQQRQRTEERLEGIEKELRAQRSNVVAKCPACDGDLSKIGVPLCKHCSSKLVWFKHCVALEGEEELAKKRYRNWELDQEARIRNRQALIERKEKQYAGLKEDCKPVQYGLIACLVAMFGGLALAPVIGVAGIVIGLGSAFIGTPIMLIVFFASGCSKVSDLKEELENTRG